MALSEHDTKTLATFADAEVVIDDRGRNVMVSLGNWGGEVRITEHSIVYGPFGCQREWELGWNGSRDVTGAMKWAVNETANMLRADRDALVSKLTAMRDAA